MKNNTTWIDSAAKKYMDDNAPGTLVKTAEWCIDAGCFGTIVGFKYPTPDQYPLAFKAYEDGGDGMIVGVNDILAEVLSDGKIKDYHPDDLYILKDLSHKPRPGLGRVSKEYLTGKIHYGKFKGITNEQ